MSPWSNNQFTGTLVIPTGATTGARIVIDGTNGTITGYNAANNVAFVIETDPSAGFHLIADDGSEMDLLVGLNAFFELTPLDIGNIWTPAKIRTVLGASNRGGVSISSPADSVNTEHASMDFYGGGPTTNDSTILSAADTFSHAGQFFTDNIQSGSFSITPTVAGQWTANAAVNFSNTFATLPVVMVTPSGNGPGTGTTTDLQVQTTGITTTGFNCRILRGNTTPTTLSYLAVSTL